MTVEQARKEIAELSEALRRYNHEYFVLASPSVSDLDYDRTFDRLKELEEQFPQLAEPDSPVKRVGSDLSSDLPEAEHTIPVLSLDKAYSTAEIDAWITKTVRAAGRDLSFTIEEKIDGVSIVLYYENGRLSRAITRGNGYVGNDVTANVMTVRSVPLRLTSDVTVAVRGELYLEKADFERLNAKMDTPYANPRNLAAGTIRRIKSSEVAGFPLKIFVYGGTLEGVESYLDMIVSLKDLGFRVNEHMGFFSEDDEVPGQSTPEQPLSGSRGSGVSAFEQTVPPQRAHERRTAERRTAERRAAEPGIPGLVTGGFDEIDGYLKEQFERRESLPYEIDGLVIKVNEIAVREALGYTGHHPRWEIAYKFDAPEGITTIKAIDVQVGRTGRITPVARVEPVRIGGSTVSNATLHNQDYINLLELCVGDTVAVSKRGDVIPAVERVIEKNESNQTTWKMPDSCPSCGNPLVVRGAHHFCRNFECPAQVRGRLYFFAGKGQMDIDNLGPETLDTLISNGWIKRPEDIYTFDYDTLNGLPGFGEKKVSLLKKGVEESRSRPFHTVLPSLGLPELGPNVAELLIDAGYRDIELLYAAADKNDVASLTAIPGIGEKTAAAVISELKRPEVRKTIAALRAQGLSFSETGEKETGDDRFAGQTWCVTGSFEHFKPRDLAMDAVKRLGGRAVSSVSGSTTHLLAGKGAGSKLDKAKELGITIVSEEQFLRLIGETDG